MTIRAATADDVKIIQDLNDEVFTDNSKYDPDIKTDWAQSEAGRKYFNDIVDDREAICLIAEENKKAIGYIAAGPKARDYCRSSYLELENMGVLPKFRSGGIGSKLMTECLKIAKNKGYQKVYVNVYFKNKGAVQFYENNGFKKIDIDLEKDI